MSVALATFMAKQGEKRVSPQIILNKLVLFML